MIAKPLAVLTVEDCQQILQLSLQPQRINSLADLAKVKYAPFRRRLPVLAESKRKMSSICRKVCHCKNLKCNMSNVTGNSSQKSCPKKGRFEVGEPIQASERMQSLNLNFAPLLPAGDFLSLTPWCSISIINLFFTFPKLCATLSPFLLETKL